MRRHYSCVNAHGIMLLSLTDHSRSQGRVKRGFNRYSNYHRGGNDLSWECTPPRTDQRASLLSACSLMIAIVLMIAPSWERRTISAAPSFAVIGFGTEVYTVGTLRLEPEVAWTTPSSEEYGTMQPRARTALYDCCQVGNASLVSVFFARPKPPREQIDRGRYTSMHQPPGEGG